jgi:hypothetical protein
MALPTLDAVFASAADQPRRYMLSQWLVNILYSGSIEDYLTLPERYLWAKIAVAEGAPKDEAFYINAPKQYVWKDIYDAVSGSSLGTIDWGEKQALGHIAAAYRGDTGNPANLATYIDWPWRYQIASIVTNTAIDTDTQAFITTSGATDVEALDQFVKGVKNLGLWDSMVAWPLRSTQNAGTGTTAYSLGGLGTYNGTLVNGPTWGSDGVVFAATNRQINLPDETALRNTRTVFAAFRPNSNAFNQIVFSVDSAISTGIYSDLRFDGQNFAGLTQGFKLALTRGGVQSISQNGSRTIGLGAFRSGGYTANDSADNVFINGALESGGARTGLAALNATGTPTSRRLFGASSDMVGAFVMSSTATLTNQQFADLTTLYKTTLGTGLSLP